MKLLRECPRLCLAVLLTATAYPALAADCLYPDRREGGVTFAWCSQQKCNPEVELDTETADFHSITPGKER